MDIKAIEIGWGTDSTYYSTTDKEDSPYYVERITEQPIVIAGNMILSYVGFRDGRLVLRVFAGSNLIIHYKSN